MNIMKIKNFNISNGSGIGVSVYVSGCPLHCPGCFNQEAWDPSAGKEMTRENLMFIMSLLARPEIDHLSVLGGEPLAVWNTSGVRELITEARKKFPEKKIWLWTGYMPSELDETQREIAGMCDYVTYGRYEAEKTDLNRKYSGSSNQFTVRKDGKVIEEAKTQEEKGND